MNTNSPVNRLSALTIEAISQFCDIANASEQDVHVPTHFEFKRVWVIGGNGGREPEKTVEIKKRKEAPACLSVTTQYGQLEVEAPLEEWELAQVADDDQLLTELRVSPEEDSFPLVTLGTYGPRVKVIEGAFHFVDEGDGKEHLLL